MKASDYIRIALKNFARQKLRTTLTVLAITVGSLSLILMFSILIGISQSLNEAFDNMGAFELVTVTRDPNSVYDSSGLIGASNIPSAEDGAKIDDDTLELVREIPNVASATPTLSVWAKTIRLEGHDKKMWPNLLAYDPKTNVFKLPIAAGRGLEPNDMDKIVVGWEFVQAYGYSANPQGLVGKKVILTQEVGPYSMPDWGPLPPKPSGNDKNENRIISIDATIVGVLKSNMEANQNYINIDWAKKLITNVSWTNDDEAIEVCQNNRQQKEQELAENGQNLTETVPSCEQTTPLKLSKESDLEKEGYGSIIIRVNNKESIKSVSQEIEMIGYGSVTAQKMVDQLKKVFAAVSAVLGVIGGISLFVAALGIINTMVMATHERTREIGVLRACGATKKTVRRLFTYEAAFIGFFGGLLGIIIGAILGAFSKVLLEQFGSSFNDLPIEHIGDFQSSLVIPILVFTTLLGLVAGLYPAIRASKLNPVEAIHNE